MASSRLFGFRPSKERTGEAGLGTSGAEPDRGIIAVLADKLLHRSNRDLPESGAWGISPAERYVKNSLGQTGADTSPGPQIASPSAGGVGDDAL